MAIEKDRRRPSNNDILIELKELKKDVEYMAENTKKMADNNVLQWNAIRDTATDLSKIKGAGMAITFILSLLSIIGIYIGIFCS